MGTHPIFESDFDCLTENGSKMPLNVLYESPVGFALFSVLDEGKFKEVGAVHEVPGLLPAPALLKTVNGGASLTVGTSAIVSHSFVKREAEADPALLYRSYGYGLGHHGYAGYGGYGYAGLGYAGYGGYPGYGYAHYG